MSSVWFVVPARGGSKGIPDKNIRLLAGKPLIRHVLDTIRTAVPNAKIILTSDSQAILSYADASVLAHQRSANTASDTATIDDVTKEVVTWITTTHGAKPDDLLFTVQPTSPLLSPVTVGRALAALQAGTADTILSVTEERKLAWKKNPDGALVPLYQKRLNRQQLEPTFRETGAVVGCLVSTVTKLGTRFGAKVAPLLVDSKESIDIDSFEDWVVAEYLLNQKRIAVRADGSKQVGFGHIYRALALAQAVGGHELKIFCRTDGDYALGYDFLKKYPYQVTPLKSAGEGLELMQAFKPHLIINDILDTTEEYMQSLPKLGAFVVNFEDLGKGAKLANVVVNDLYAPLLPHKHIWSGVAYSVLHPQFEAVPPATTYPQNVSELMVVFGGTDENNLTVKTIEAVVKSGYKGQTTIVVGPGNAHFDEINKHVEALKKTHHIKVLKNVESMAKLMQGMHLAISSAGRTVTELMTMGVPTIALCQNARELRHSHTSIEHGVINLNLGAQVTAEALAENLRDLLDNHNLRSDMRSRMFSVTKSRKNGAIITAIMREYDEWKKNN